MTGNRRKDVTKARRASKKYQYDVCLSFAGENRRYVDSVANELRGLGIRVFYDRYEQVELWGKDLYARICTMSIARPLATACYLFQQAFPVKFGQTTSVPPPRSARSKRTANTYFRLDSTTLLCPVFAAQSATLTFALSSLRTSPKWSPRSWERGNDQTTCHPCQTCCSEVT